jgi:hypothetical protein
LRDMNGDNGGRRLTTAGGLDELTVLLGVGR